MHSIEILDGRIDGFALWQDWRPWGLPLDSEMIPGLIFPWPCLPWLSLEPRFSLGASSVSLQAYAPSVKLNGEDSKMREWPWKRLEKRAEWPGGILVHRAGWQMGIANPPGSTYQNPSG